MPIVNTEVCVKLLKEVDLMLGVLSQNNDNDSDNMNK